MGTSRVPFTTTIVVGLLVAACASPTSSAPIVTPSALPAGASPTPAAPSAGPTATSTAPPTLPPLPASASLPVRGSAKLIGVQIAPGPGGTLFTSIARSRASVLALLDSNGRPRPGWPISVEDSTSCEELLPVDDGSVRVICTLENPDGDTFGPTRAFAFDSNGSMLAGWPVDLGDHGVEGYFAARVVGDELTIYAWAAQGETGSAWVLIVAADGAVRNGTQVPFVNCCDPRWAIGPERVAYGSINQWGDSPEAPRSSELVAVSFVGARAGFPIVIDGIASEPAFDATGRIHLTVAREANGPARTLVFDPDGRAAAGGSGELGISATDECRAIEGSCEVPAAPLVGLDGTTFVVEAHYNSTTAAGVNPSGRVMPGWPYRSEAGYQGLGNCCPGDSDPSFNVAAPAIGPGNVLYLLHGAETTSVGGSIVAVGPDGRVRPGWPVELERPGAEFWSVVVGAYGTVYALAIEPESGDASSATIVAIAPDSTVLWTTTIIEP